MDRQFMETAKEPATQKKSHDEKRAKMKTTKVRTRRSCSFQGSSPSRHRERETDEETGNANKHTRTHNQSINQSTNKPTSPLR